MVTAAFNSGRNRTLKATLQMLGLMSNLKLCLDAGDINSYPGSGTKWLDVSGNGYDFDNNGATFNGTAGRQSGSEYFSFDGGDYLSYDSAIESWMQAFGKPDHAYSILAIVYLPSDTDTPIVATRGDTPTERGIGLEYSSTANRVVAVTANSGESGFFSSGGYAPTTLDTLLPGLFIYQITGTIGPTSRPFNSMVNGNAYTGADSTHSASSNNPSNNMKLMAYGDLSTIAPSGTRLYGLAIWDTVGLTAVQQGQVYQALRNRFGV